MGQYIDFAHLHSEIVLEHKPLSHRIGALIGHYVIALH
jgi:hypothetical protein